MLDDDIPDHLRSRIKKLPQKREEEAANVIFGIAFVVIVIIVILCINA